MLNADIQASTERPDSKRLFKNIDGIKFFGTGTNCNKHHDKAHHFQYISFTIHINYY